MSKKKTSKAFRDYHSSDYGNEDEDEDYGPEFEDEEELRPRDGRSPKRKANHPDLEDSDSNS